MAPAQSARRRGPSRANDPARAHSFVVQPPEGRYDYDPRKDLPTCPDDNPGQQWELTSARLWEGRFREGRLVDHRTRFYPSKQALTAQVTRLRESNRGLAREHYGQLRTAKLREAGPDWWSYGLNNTGAFGGPLTQYIPLLPGPATRQLYWADYFAMSAKAFEAYQHNPIAHRSVEIGTEFVLGRGVEARAKTPRAQAVWDAFWRKNKMDERLEWICGDLTTYGELFLRYFPQPGRTLVVRSLDPAGIYEIVTDQEDWESVYFYHQQEQERAQLFAPPQGNIAPTGPTTGGVTRYTIRQIPAQEIDHYRINARSGEVRGRSDLFPALGYLKRLQDLLTSRVIRSDMEARMVFDLMVEGNEVDVRAQKNAIFPNGQPPEPGSIIGHNKAIELNAFQFSSGTEAAGQGTVEELVAMCALGTGVSMQYLWTVGHSGGGARANALVATEPGQKRFERRQRLMQRILGDMADRLFDLNGFTGEDREIEFIFPSIAVEERSATLKDIAFAESMGWLSKQTGASMGARALDIETFDFENEQKLIAEEFDHSQDEEDDSGKPQLLGPDGTPIQSTKPMQGGGVIRRPMMSAQYRQAPKLDPTKAGTAEDQPPGLLMPGDAGEEPPGAPGTGQTAPTRSGFPGDENPLGSAGAANIRKDNLRESDPVVRLAAIAIREAHAAAARIPRRRPDDPEFLSAAQQYEHASAAAIEQLVASAHPAAVEPAV